MRPGVDFTNIYEQLLQVQIPKRKEYVIFALLRHKLIKAVHKMLMKLTSGVNFTHFWRLKLLFFAIHSHQQLEVEVIINLYTLRSMPFASENSINLLPEKLLWHTRNSIYR
jgi:hypothetical protein